jgi:nucleotide-binding universal stress UspA family protein
MTIKTILVPLHDGDSGEAVLKTALAAARRFDAHIEVLHTHVSARDSFGYMTGTIRSGPASLLETVREAAEKAAKEDHARNRETFERFCVENDVPVVDSPPPPAPVSATWVERTGRKGEILMRRSRYASLFVIPRPQDEGTAGAILEILLLDTRRPALLAPPQPLADFGNRVLIAWNGSVEAARAVNSAMPFLMQAQAVTILTRLESDKPEYAPEEVLKFLGWNGVEAQVQGIDTESRPVGEAILAQAADVDADLLIMGGYGHSRMREMILGGATQHILGNATIPVFLAH